jgi:hypothetical protein
VAGAGAGLMSRRQTGQRRRSALSRARVSSPAIRRSGEHGQRRSLDATAAPGREQGGVCIASDMSQYTI